MNLSLRFLADLAERVVWTFLQAYFGFWIAAGPEFDTLFTLDGLKVATAAAALVVGSTVIRKPVGNPDSASVLPPAAQPPAPKPADTTLEPAEAAPAPVQGTIDPTLLSPSTLATLTQLAQLIQPVATPAPAAAGDVKIGATPEDLERYMARTAGLPPAPPPPPR